MTGGTGTPTPLLAEGWWTLILYPEAAEAGGSYRRRRRTEPVDSAADPERSAEEAARRARGKIRRYCAANRLNRLGTLTYAGEGCLAPEAVRADVASFFRALRGEVGEAFPYLWVPELHPGGHGFHIHFAVGRFIKWTLLRDTWGRGRVHIKLIGDLPVGSGALGEARAAGRYLAKYAAKDIYGDGACPAGWHRYEVAQGFQPESIECYGPTVADAIQTAATYMGASPSQCWLSAESEGWLGPPACWVAWD